jgi:glycosyltransferase involved in cell wall biosynthesis
MSASGPLVSIAVFSYNTARYLPALCQSIQAQTYRNFEALIYDDGSTDNSVEVASSFLKDGRFQLIAWKPNKGLGQGITTALERIRGEFSVMIAADDELKPDFLKRRMALMEQHPEVTMIHGAAEFIDESGGLLPETSPLGGHALLMRTIEKRVRQLPPVMDSAEALRLLLQHNVVCAPSIFLRASATRRMIPPALAKWDWASDWFLCLLHAAAGKVAYDPEPLVRYRIHAGSMSHQPRFSAPKQAEIRMIPLCALSLAAKNSPEAARLWSRYRKPLYALWLRRALVLKRAGLLNDAWLRTAAAAYYGQDRKTPVSLQGEVAGRVFDIAWYGLKESLARRQWMPVSGLAQMNHSFFAGNNQAEKEGGG